MRKRAIAAAHGERESLKKDAAQVKQAAKVRRQQSRMTSLNVTAVTTHTPINNSTINLIDDMIADTDDFMTVQHEVCVIEEQFVQ